MRNVLAAIGRVLRALAATTWTMVWEGGKWVLRLLPGVTAPAPEVGPSDEVLADVEAAKAATASTKQVDEIGPVKRLARLMWAGAPVTAEHMHGITDRELEWLRVLDQDMLHKLAMADREQIDTHMRGRAPIRGMVPFDPAAVADMKRARAMPAPSPRRTLREVLEERGIHP